MTMREILFRGKHICGNGDWIYGYYFQKPDPCTKDGKPIAHCISDLPPFGSEIVISTLGQYTGLTDKHGRKIFEGDIIKENDVIHNGELQYEGLSFAVVYANGCWFAIRNNRRGERKAMFLGGCCDVSEVIGNIHDNPELMEDE